MEYKPLARSSDLLVQDLKGETLIYDLKTNKAKCLNETSASVWALCNGKRNASDVGKVLSKKLKTIVSEDFIWFAFDQLEKEELLDGRQRPTIKFEGLSRRQVVRKIGFAAVVALPLISSVVAPMASHAQSVNVNPCQNAPGDPANCACGIPGTGPPPSPEDKCCWFACDTQKLSICEGTAKADYTSNCSGMMGNPPTWSTPAPCDQPQIACEVNNCGPSAPNQPCCSDDNLQTPITSDLSNLPSNCSSLYLHCGATPPPRSPGDIENCN